VSAAATLEVVVLTTPDQEPERPSIERVAAQSRGAREALSISAELSGAHDGPWQKDVEHVPLPQDGWHWSISHDAHWSAAIVGRSRVGIDVERIERRRGEMVEALISPAERLHLTDPDGVDALVFARIWTAKEAVLKSFGIGLGIATVESFQIEMRYAAMAIQSGDEEITFTLFFGFIKLRWGCLF